MRVDLSSCVKKKGNSAEKGENDIFFYKNYEVSENDL